MPIHHLDADSDALDWHPGMTERDPVAGFLGGSDGGDASHREDIPFL